MNWKLKISGNQGGGGGGAAMEVGESSLKAAAGELGHGTEARAVIWLLPRRARRPGQGRTVGSKGVNTWKGLRLTTSSGS